MAQLDLNHKKRILMHNSQKNISRRQKEKLKPQAENPALLFKFLKIFQQKSCLVKQLPFSTSNMHTTPDRNHLITFNTKANQNIDNKIFSRVANQKLNLWHAI